MKKLVRYIVGNTYKPVLQKYLSKERLFQYKGLNLRIHPHVFHPGFFYSTKLLLAQVLQYPLAGKTLLEPGAGSGLISMMAARAGAIVTATDINATAIDYLHQNSATNIVPLNIIQSNLFEQIPAKAYDIVAINPPYYKKDPAAEAEYAWYCGTHGSYFQRLFANLAAYIHPKSVVLMICCDGCDMDMITAYAKQYDFVPELLQTHRNWIETNFIYNIKQQYG